MLHNPVAKNCIHDFPFLLKATASKPNYGYCQHKVDKMQDFVV